MNSRTALITILLAITSLVVALFFLGTSRDEHSGKPLVLYCAAGIKPAILPLAESFEREYGQPVQLMYGGSGTLLSNLQVANTGDLYIAADQSYIELAQQKDLVREVLPLARMRPVIVVQRGNPKNIHRLQDLVRGDIRLVIGNPDAASIGKQTKILLEQAGLWESIKGQVENKGVFKPTVMEVANDVKLGAVDAGIVWDATAFQYPDIDVIHVPEFESAREQISISVLKYSDQPTMALRFARYLNSTIGNEVFARHGFEPVAGDKWEWHPELTFFCGSVNRRAVDQVIKEFEQREGVTINTIYNGCGILTGQMRTINQQDGAGFPDVYMACDRYYLDSVHDWFQEDVNISDADIVIAVPKGNPAGITGIADLAKDGIRVSVGQPEQCTIGALTRIMLENMGIYDQVMKNVVMQTASSSMLVPTVATKSVDAAISYITDTLAESDKVDSIKIDSVHAKAVQPFSIARSSDYKYLGRRLYAEVARARERFEAAGFHFLLEDAQ